MSNHIRFALMDAPAEREKQPSASGGRCRAYVRPIRVSIHKSTLLMVCRPIGITAKTLAS